MVFWANTFADSVQVETSWKIKQTFGQQCHKHHMKSSGTVVLEMTDRAIRGSQGRGVVKQGSKIF